MRLIARLTDHKQVGFLVDALRNNGFDRKGMIISNPAEEQKWTQAEDAADEISFIKTERDGLWEIGTFAEGVKGLKGREGILVSVEAPQHDAARVRELMEQSGAVEIVQD